MIKKLLVLLFIGVLIAIAGAFYIKQDLHAYVEQPVMLEDTTLFTVKPGSSLRGVLAQMEKESWINHSQFSRLLPKLYPEFISLKAGTYLLEPHLSLQQTLMSFVSGNEHQFTITFIEGSRFSEWREQLQSAPGLIQKTDTMSEGEIAKALGIKQDKLEGLMLAETYHYTQGMSDLDILKRAHQALTQVLDTEWQARQKNLPLKSPYEALILASIIEKETAIDSERERVSSVFVNRLNKRMRLQTDPTVIYGMGDKYDGNIRKKDLTTRTAYNTYVINGLPPTPIAMAGVRSIQAALHPENSSYLYFVASGNGGHVFSRSLAEHNRAVRNYLRTLRANKSQ